MRQPTMHYELCTMHYELKYLPTKLGATPIFRPFYETDLERFWSEFEAKVKKS